MFFEGSEINVKMYVFVFLFLGFRIFFVLLGFGCEDFLKEGFSFNGYILLNLVLENGYKDMVEFFLKEGVDFYVFDYWMVFCIFVF